ncbi:hypothetical protein ABZ671_21265 [Micromonospora sp. NPDC006766]|uniref:hypothetical protein n=1 Tax=Micromonospora sp. NPDC006766 TaxID=3154778 RepID=UPI0033F5469E
MKIDDQVEQPVRDALHWIVKEQEDEFNAALQAFPDDASRQAALELLVTIARYVIIEAYSGPPSVDEVRELAGVIVEAESWLPLSHSEVERYLQAVLAGTPLIEHLEPETAVVLAFAVAGCLLASRPQPSGEWWFNYLDKVEAAIEAAG